MEQRDRQALEDILGVLDRALEFPIPNSQTLEDTTYLQDAVIRCLEVLGEALNAQIKLQKRTIMQLLFSGFNQSLDSVRLFVNSVIQFYLSIFFNPIIHHLWHE